MKVKEWKKELECYDEDSEVIFEICDDIECESWTETKYGTRSVNVDCELKENFVFECLGNCRIELGVKHEG